MNRCISRGLAKLVTIEEQDSAYFSSLITSNFASVSGFDNVGALMVNGSSLMRNHGTIDTRLAIRLGGTSYNRNFYLYRKDQPAMSWSEVYQRETENREYTFLNYKT